MKRILICEDEATIREFVVINLKRAGYDVVDVDCGEAAPRHLRTAARLSKLLKWNMAILILYCLT